MKNDKGASPSALGLSERGKITESPKDLGLDHSKGHEGKPMGGPKESQYRGGGKGLKI